MTKRRETRLERVADTIRFTLLPSWKVSLAILVVVLLACLMWFWATRPTLTQTGEIIRFGPHSSRLRADRIAVVVKAPDGTITELLPKARDVARCRPGDRISYTTGPNGLWIDRCDRPGS